MIRLLNNNRRALIAIAVVVAFVAVVVPACRMVGCTMSSGSMNMAHDMGGLGFFGDCGGTYVTSALLPAAVPPTATMNILLLMAAIFMATFVLSQPPVVVQRIHVHESDPPPPPEDPRGERLRL